MSGPVMIMVDNTLDKRYSMEGKDKGIDIWSWRDTHSSSKYALNSQ